MAQVQRSVGRYDLLEVIGRGGAAVVYRSAHAPRMCYYYVMRSIGERSTDPALLVLTSLAEGPKHGYAITLDVEQLAGVRLGPGTLYGALSRLEGKGLIEALPAEDRRRPYRLTDAGSAALAEHLQALERVARSGLDRLRVAEALQ
jgi:DNA-binding PadR family transcriptional regulator